MIATFAALVTLAATAPAATVPPGPAPFARPEADSIRRSIEKDREATRQWLKSGATSYLAAILRADFHSRDRLSFGSSPTNDVRLDDPAVRPEHLAVTVVGDSFRVAARDDSAFFKLGERKLQSATMGPGRITVGRFALRLSHQRNPAIIVFDPQSPRLKGYKGIEYFPVDLRWRYVLPLTPDPRPDTVVVLSTLGHERRALRVGWFDFRAGGTRCRLEAHRLLEPGVGDNDLSVFFRDETTGKETYPIGRYLDPVALGNGRYVLDFNLAYNPACAYSEHYNCPIPSRANRLRVAVRAGEKDARYLDKPPGR